MTTHSAPDAAPSMPWEEISAEARRDRRREPRLKLPFPVEVYGFDHHGLYFMERTATLNVSPSGCMLELKHQPDEKGVLAIRRVSREGTRLEGHKPVLFEVCWAHRSGRRWFVGACKLQSGDVWGLSSPSNNPGN